MQVCNEEALRERVGDDLAIALNRVHHALYDTEHFKLVADTCEELHIDFHPSPRKDAA